MQNENLDIYKFLCIKSVIEILNPEKIYFHIIENNNLDDDLMKKFNNEIITINYTKINYDTIDIFIFIFDILKNYGGVYLDFSILIINDYFFKKIKNVNFFKSNNDKIIGSEQNSYMLNKYLEHKFHNNKNTIFNQKFGIRNINGRFLNNYLLDNSDIFNQNEIDNFLFNEIIDYSFSHYFYLIKNFSILNLVDDCDECINLKKINFKDIFLKTTIYNLLIKYILGYKFFFKSNKLNLCQNISACKNKFKLINNIDYVFWINLDSSRKRAQNMINILSIFSKNIICERISAIDGDKIENICNKYFYLEYKNEKDNIINNEIKEYPKYSNKEYAVLLSHLSAIEKFINIDESKLIYKNVLICEDDLSLDFLNYWKIDIKTLIENAPIDWEIIMLGYFTLNMNKTGLYNKWNNEFSAIAYLVNYNIKDKLKLMKKEDKWICNEKDLMVSDNYIFSKFNTYLYKYPFFTFPNNNDSTFHEDHINYHKIYKNINYLILENIYEKYFNK